MTKIIDLSVKEKIYKSKKAQISILNDFRLEVTAGEKIAIVGESGADAFRFSDKSVTYKPVSAMAKSTDWLCSSRVGTH